MIIFIAEKAVSRLALASQAFVHFYQIILISKVRITLGSMGFHKAMTASWLSWTTYVFVDLNTSKCIHEYLQGALHALFTSQLSCAVEINRLKVLCVCVHVRTRVCARACTYMCVTSLAT